MCSCLSCWHVKHVCHIYFHLWCVWLYCIFPHYLMNGMAFLKYEISCNSILSSRSQDVPYGLMDEQRHDSAFHSCANTPKN